MRANIARLKYGAYEFGIWNSQNPLPYVGTRDITDRQGATKTAHAPTELLVTLAGHVTGRTLAEVLEQVDALKAAFKKNDQLLYWYDGVRTHINNVPATVTDIRFAEEWQQYEANYTITLKCFLTDQTYDQTNVGPGGAVSYNGFIFSDPNGSIVGPGTTAGSGKNAPVPVFGIETNIERETPFSSQWFKRHHISLSGYFEGSFSANKTALDALQAAVVDGGTLAYGSYSFGNLKVKSFNRPPDPMTRICAWSIVFYYDAPAGNDGVLESNYKRKITRVTPRTAVAYAAFMDGAVVQSLGAGGQMITLIGGIVAQSMAAAQAALINLIAAQFPPNVDSGTSTEFPYGIEQTSNEVTEDEHNNRIDFSIARFYPQPALTGGVYGNYGS